MDVRSGLAIIFPFPSANPIGRSLCAWKLGNLLSCEFPLVASSLSLIYLPKIVSTQFLFIYLQSKSIHLLPKKSLSISYQKKSRSISYQKKSRSIVNYYLADCGNGGGVLPDLKALDLDTKMEGAAAAGYWCHMCSQTVNPIREVELKCPFCSSGFIEEMDSSSRRLDESDLASERAMALWAPILLGMMGNQHSRQRIRPHLLDENNTDDENENADRPREGETELDRELDAIIRRRRRSSAAVLQLLQGISAGISAETESLENDRGRERERFFLINPFDQNVLGQGAEDSNHDQNPFESLGDYFIGPGLDLLLQHLAENDPNRHGTPPAQKEAIDALPTVIVGDNLQCPVCLDDFEPSADAKEMPCKHKFHSGCLLPWLELHSSCPVCRFLLPADESKRDADVSREDNHRGSGNARDLDEQGRNENSFTFPWPLSTFSSPRSRGNSSLSPSTSRGRGSSSQADGS